MSLAKKMGDAHEAFIAEALGGRQTRGSGNQWRDPADGRMDRREHPVAFAWDCKSTRAASATIKRADLDKLVEQSHGDRPLLPVRFYDDDRLRGHEDWALIRVDDLVELMERLAPGKDAWLELGRANGWVTEFCAMHDVGPMTPEENEVHADGGDPCIPSLRVWP
jgi:hypothetical protein